MLNSPSSKQFRTAVHGATFIDCCTPLDTIAVRDCDARSTYVGACPGVMPRYNSNITHHRCVRSSLNYNAASLQPPACYIWYDRHNSLTHQGNGAVFPRTNTNLTCYLFHTYERRCNHYIRVVAINSSSAPLRVSIDSRIALRCDPAIRTHK